MHPSNMSNGIDVVRIGAKSKIGGRSRSGESGSNKIWNWSESGGKSTACPGSDVEAWRSSENETESPGTVIGVDTESSHPIPQMSTRLRPRRSIKCQTRLALRDRLRSAPSRRWRLEVSGWNHGPLVIQPELLQLFWAKLVRVEEI